MPLRRAGRLLAAVSLAVLATSWGGAHAQSNEVSALLDRASAAYALGALDRAEEVLREALRLDPENERARRLLGEVRVERERALRAPRPGAVEGAAPQEEAGPTSLAPPSLPVPAPRLEPLERRTWGRPGAEGLRAVVLERHEDRVVLRVQVPPGTLPSTTQSFARPPMFAVYLEGVVDNLPSGPLEVGAAGLLRVRHSQYRRDPNVASLVLDLAAADVPVDVTASAGEVVITVGAHPPERSSLEGPAYRPPVQGAWRLSIAGGDGQAAVAGSAFPHPLVVRVADAAGRPVADAEVVFTSPDAAVLFPDAEGGAGGTARVRTNEEGLAAAAVRSAGPAGTKVVRSSVVAADGSRSEVSFQVGVRTGPPAAVLKASGDGQDVRTRHLIEEPLVVAVQDAHGNPVAGVPVRFAYVEGDGWLKPSFDTPLEPVTLTDARGLASWAHVRAGPYAGAHRVTASIEAGGAARTVEFAVRAVPVVIRYLDLKDEDLVEAIRAIAEMAGWNVVLSDEFVGEYERSGGRLTIGGDPAENPHSGRGELERWYRGQVTAHFENVSADAALDHILWGKNLARLEMGDGVILVTTLQRALDRPGGVLDGSRISASLPDGLVRSAAFRVPLGFDQTTLANFLRGSAGTTEIRTLFDASSQTLFVTAQVGILRKVADLIGRVESGRWKVATYRLRWSPNQGVLGQSASGITTVGQTIDALLLQVLTGGTTGGQGEGGIYQNVGVNAFTIWGPPERVDRAIAILREIDEAWKEDNNFEIIPLRHRSASEVRADAQNLIFGSFFEFVPLQQLNAIMLVGVVGPEGRWEYFREIVRALDVPVPVRAVRFDRLDPATAVSTLTPLYPGLNLSAFAGPPRILILRGDTDLIERAVSLARQLEGPGTLRVYKARHAHASPALLNYVQAFFPDLQVLAPDAGGRTEYVVLRGEAARMDEAIALFRRIDAPNPPRVVHEAKIRSATAITTLLSSLYTHTGFTVFDRFVLADGDADAGVVEEAARFAALVDSEDPYEVVPLRFLQPATVATNLQTLFPSLTVLQQTEARRLILRGDAATLARARRFLADLGEAPGETAAHSPRHVLPLREVDASTMLGILQTLYPGVTIVASGDANALIVYADRTVFDEIRALVVHLDRGLQTAIRPLFVANATDIVTIVTPFLSPSGSIQADLVTNAVIVTDALERLDKILKIIDELDVQPSQILIEAAFVEVILNDNASLGVSWNWNPDLTDIDIPFGDANVQMGQNPISVRSGQASPTTLPNPLIQTINPTTNDQSFQLGVSKANLTILLQALKTQTDIRVVSTPKVMTINNQQATFSVSDEINIPVSNFNQNGNLVAITFDQRPVQIALRVTPRISIGGRVIRMEVNPRVQEPVSQPAGQPSTVSSREATTTVMIEDGHTLIIGGLIRKKETEQVRKVPILGDIPAIGNLFRNTSRRQENTELLVFLTPRIIQPNLVAAQMEEELSRYRYLVNFPVDWTGASRRVRPTEPPSSAPTRPPSRAEGGAPPSVAPRVDVNWATSAELAAVPGMPEHVARLIVLDRQTRGPFASVEDVRRVPGVTDDVFAAVARHLQAERVPTVSEPRAAAAPAPPPSAEPAAALLDLNAATAEELARVPGLEEFQARMIVAYRNSYGPFASVDDLARVPGMTAEALARARPRLAAGGAPARPAPAVDAAPRPAATDGRVDLNTASAEELARVPGLEEFHARMIVAYRNTYGPFASVDDLANVPGLTPDVIAAARPGLRVGRGGPGAPTGLLDLNAATEADLAALPGLDSYYAKLIVAYRSYYGPFASVEDVLRVPGVTAEMLARFRDRVTVRPAGSG